MSASLCRIRKHIIIIEDGENYGYQIFCRKGTDAGKSTSSGSPGKDPGLRSHVFIVDRVSDPFGVGGEDCVYSQGTDPGSDGCGVAHTGEFPESTGGSALWKILREYDLYCGGSAGDPVRTDYIGGLCFCENRFLRLQSIIRIVPFTADDRTGSTDPAQLFHDGKMGTDGHEDRHYAPFFCFGHGNSDRATDHQDDPL